MGARSNDAAKVLGPLEAELMEIVWSRAQPIPVRHALERLNAGRGEPLAYTTVMTVMNRLVEKEVLRRRKEGRGYVYEAVADDAAGIAVQAVLRDFGDAAVTHFLEEVSSDPDVLRRLRLLVKEPE